MTGTRKGHTMGYLILIFVGFSILFALTMYWANKLTEKYVVRIMDTRFTSLEQIVNDKRVPDAWLHPFRKKLAAARKSGAGDAKLTRLGQQTQQRCLRRIEDMLQYATGVNFTDTRETKEVIVKELKAQREQWETMDWQAWIAVLDTPEAPPKTKDEDPTADTSDAQNL